MQKQAQTQYKTEASGIPAGVRLRQAVRENLRWLGAIVYAAVGFVMANSSVFDGISPFGVAFCASLGGVSAVPAALGAVVGYIFSSAMTANMKYIAAVSLVVAIKLIFGSNRAGIFIGGAGIKRTAATSVITAFFAMLVAGTAVIFSNAFTLYDLVLSLSEIFMTCGAAYFFARALNSISAGWNGASKADISCVVISFAIIVMGFSDIRISGLSVGRILAVLVILLAARYGGEAAGSVAGIISGIAMSLAGAEMNYVIAAYAFGGLISGVFGSGGRIATAASFIAVNAVVAFLTQDSLSIYDSMFEVFIASVIFAAIPQSWVSRLRPMRTSTADGGYARSILRDRLSDVAAALAEIGATTRKVSDGLGKLEPVGNGEIAARVAERVCKRCAMKNTCWQFCHNDTVNAINSALAALKRRGSLSGSAIPAYFTENCIKVTDITTELNLQFQNYTAREGVQRKVSQVRSVITDQFDGLSIMLGELSEEICSVKAFDEGKARRVKDYFEKECIDASRVQVQTDEFDRMCVSFVIPNYHIAKLRPSKSALDLCGILENEFDQPQITARQQHATVVFTEKALFTAEYGAYQIADGGNRLCGDSYECIKNKSGKAHFILSDGMGSGGSAAVDSTMAASLISQLLSAGISHEAALKMVNSALMIKSGDESLATLDVTTLDLFTGRADFYKAGAAPTYIIKNGRASYAKSSSLPAGILRGVAFEHSVTALRDKDIIVMVSDGVTATGLDWVKSELESLKSCDMQRLCEKLAVTAKSRRTDFHEDDITVIAVSIRRVE